MLIQNSQMISVTLQNALTITPLCKPMIMLTLETIKHDNYPGNDAWMSSWQKHELIMLHS